MALDLARFRADLSPEGKARYADVPDDSLIAAVRKDYAHVPQETFDARLNSKYGIAEKTPSFGQRAIRDVKDIAKGTAALGQAATLATIPGGLHMRPSRGPLAGTTPQEMMGAVPGSVVQEAKAYRHPVKQIKEHPVISALDVLSLLVPAAVGARAARGAAAAGGRAALRAGAGAAAREAVGIPGERRAPVAPKPSGDLVEQAMAAAGRPEAPSATPVERPPVGPPIPERVVPAERRAVPGMSEEVRDQIAQHRIEAKRLLSEPNPTPRAKAMAQIEIDSANDLIASVKGQELKPRGRRVGEASFQPPEKGSRGTEHLETKYAGPERRVTPEDIKFTRSYASSGEVPGGVRRHTFELKEPIQLQPGEGLQELSNLAAQVKSVGRKLIEPNRQTRAQVDAAQAAKIAARESADEGIRAALGEGASEEQVSAAMAKWEAVQAEKTASLERARQTAGAGPAAPFESTVGPAIPETAPKPAGGGPVTLSSLGAGQLGEHAGLITGPAGRLTTEAPRGVPLRPPEDVGLQLSQLPIKERGVKTPFGMVGGKLAVAANTFDRNMETFFGDAAPMVKAQVGEPVKAAVTQSSHFVSTLRRSVNDQIVKGLGIGRRSKESFAAADFVEGTKSLADLQREFPTKWENIQAAAEHGRAIYKSLLAKINEARTRNGYEPIQELPNYITHTKQIRSLQEQVGDLIGIRDINRQINAQPTKPGIRWFGWGQHRTGGSVHEGLIVGLDKYIEPAAHQIYLTDAIQRVRGVAKGLAQADEPRAQAVKNYLDSYADDLAGKGTATDRALEHELTGKLLNGMARLQKQVAANQIGLSASAASTNFIPALTTLPATTEKASIAKGLAQAMTTAFQRDPAVIAGQRSAHLTKRMQIHHIGADFGTRANDAGRFMFKTVDDFSNRLIVASKYYEGLSKGAKPAEAMQQADDFAGRMVGGRAIGEVPLLFKHKLFGPFSQFQYEVLNNAHFVMGDIPKKLGLSKAEVASAMAQTLIYSYLYNSLFEKFFGRRPVLDPIHITQNIVQTAKDGGEPMDYLDLSKFESPAGETIGNLPFGQIGGRIPLSAAVPDVKGVVQGRKSVWREGSKLPAYLISPYGGGGPIRRAIEGVTAYKQGEFEQTPENLIRAILGGRYSVPEVREQFGDKQLPFLPKQAFDYARRR